MNISETFGVNEPSVCMMEVATPCVNPYLIIGLELEIENCRGSDFYERSCNNNKFTITQDGSLRGQAYEFISNPMRTQHALTALKNFLHDGRFTEGNHSDRTSVHVHVNCTDMEQDNVACLALLYTVFEEIFFEFVGENRENNIYCIPWNQCRNHMDFVFNFLNDPNHLTARWQKYTALNMAPLSRQGTVEFRHMHGTADYNKLAKWINIIGALVSYADSTTLEELMTEIKTLNTSSEYEMFFRRVLRDTLDFNDTYRAKMEDGIIFAKFALITMQTETPARKKKASVRKTITTQEDIIAALQGRFAIDAAGRIVGQTQGDQAPAGQPMPNPWPPNVPMFQEPEEDEDDDLEDTENEIDHDDDDVADDREVY